MLKPIQKTELMATLQKLGDCCRARQATDAGAQRQAYRQEDLVRLNAAKQNPC